MKSEITLNESVKEAIEIALIKLLMKKDVQYMIDYVKQTYNCSDITTLYES